MTEMQKTVPSHLPRDSFFHDSVLFSQAASFASLDFDLQSGTNHFMNQAWENLARKEFGEFRRNIE